MAKDGDKGGKKRKRKKKGKSITFQNILGSVPLWLVVVLLGGITLFVGLNGYLAFSLASTDNRNLGDSMPFTSLRQRLWDKSQKRLKQNTKTILECTSYGCPINPPEYKDEQVLQALEEIKKDTALNVSFGSWEMATLTRKSNRKHPPFNQDAAVILKPYQTAQTSRNSDFFVGIFDGHGEDGHIDAQFFVKDVPKRLAQKLNNNNDGTTQKQSTSEIIQHLKDTFVESDKLAPKNITMRGGCTGSVTVRIGNQLFFANAGDSRTVLASVNSKEFQIIETGPAPGVQQLYITRADKPHLPDELARIEAAGGKVHIPPKNPNLSRVIVHSNEFNDTIGLAMSRSLGDYEWTVKGVIPEPLVDVINLDDFRNITLDPSTSLFLIAASDGLWDMRLKQWYCKQFAESFLKGDDERKIHPLAKLQEVIDFVSPKKEEWYRDDITAITLQIEKV